MSLLVEVRNRRRGRRVDGSSVKAFAEALLEREFGLDEALLGIRFVGPREMAALNRRWLGHEGSTDVLTFDLRDGPERPLHGELVVCVDEALAQAEAFGVAPDVELARYVIHGLLHLAGHDDLEAVARKKMKRVENRLVDKWTAGWRPGAWVVDSRKPSNRVSREGEAG